MPFGMGSILWEGLLDSASKEITKNWHPPFLNTEIDLRDDLERFLREASPDAHIETEYRHLGTTCDLFLRYPGFFSPSRLYVEIKLNLQAKSEFDRLLGQLEQMEPRDNNVLIILCGETDPSLLSRVRTRMEKYTGYAGSVRIVVKRFGPQ